VIDYLSILSDIQHQYLSDPFPWIIGFSGGKDSTTVMQMVFQALSKLPKQKLNKEIHVVCSDTLVENPIHLRKIEATGKQELFSHRPNLFKVIKVKPSLEDSFWVNLIGKGYPSPNLWFRWCTERLKINPTSAYIKKTLLENEKAIILLGTRKAESTNRAASMEKYDTGARLKNHRLPNVYVYTPIADLSNNEVWAYLLQVKNPWGKNNRDLLKLYGNACDDGECPFVIDTGTQSCGKSRFGCWVCTVVDRDKSMENLVGNGHGWMKKLLDFMNWIYTIRQQSYQNIPFKIPEKIKFGPFLLSTRLDLLRRINKIQKELSKYISKSIISCDELSIINNLLSIETNDITPNKIKQFSYQLRSGKKLQVYSDFDILRSSKKRLGAYTLTDAKILDMQDLNWNKYRLTRVIYFEENQNSKE